MNVRVYRALSELPAHGQIGRAFPHLGPAPAAAVHEFLHQGATIKVPSPAPKPEIQHGGGDKHD